MFSLILAGKEYHGWEPCWFKKSIDKYTGNPIHEFTNEYWACKDKQDWSRCPDIYLSSPPQPPTTAK